MQIYKVHGQVYHNTFVPILVVGDAAQVDVVSPYGDVIHAAFIYHLDLHPLAKRGEHLLKDDLLVPHRLRCALLGRGPTLTCPTERQGEREEECASEEQQAVMFVG